jgi:hypothetical protein
LRLYGYFGDGEALANRILELAGDRNLCATLGARARFAFERQWDKEKALAKWEALLQAVGHPGLGSNQALRAHSKSPFRAISGHPGTSID